MAVPPPPRPPPLASVRVTLSEDSQVVFKTQTLIEQIHLQANIKSLLAC